MKAIDTNLLVRVLTDDDPRQAARARAVLCSETVFVATTVILETDWVLRSRFELTQRESSRALRAFFGLPTVQLENPDRVGQALDRAEDGIDFADALHIGSATEAGCEAFLTFDHALMRSGGGKMGLPIAEPKVPR